MLLKSISILYMFIICFFFFPFLQRSNFYKHNKGNSIICVDTHAHEKGEVKLVDYRFTISFLT